MSKIHIGKNGPAQCHAQEGNCPLGGESGEENHFDNMKDAEKAFEKQQGGAAPKSLSSMKSLNARVAKNDVKAIKEKFPNETTVYPAGDYMVIGLNDNWAERGGMDVYDEDYELLPKYQNIADKAIETSYISGNGFTGGTGIIDTKDLTEEDKKALAELEYGADDVLHAPNGLAVINPPRDDKNLMTKDTERFVEELDKTGVNIKYIGGKKNLDRNELDYQGVFFGGAGDSLRAEM